MRLPIRIYALGLGISGLIFNLGLKAGVASCIVVVASTLLYCLYCGVTTGEIGVVIRKLTQLGSQRGKPQYLPICVLLLAPLSLSTIYLSTREELFGYLSVLLLLVVSALGLTIYFRIHMRVIWSSMPLVSAFLSIVIGIYSSDWILRIGASLSLVLSGIQYWYEAKTSD